MWCRSGRRLPVDMTINPRSRRPRSNPEEDSHVRGVGAMPATLREIEKALVSASKARPGSPSALEYSQRALAYLALAIGPALGREFDEVPRDAISRRERWLAVLRFLHGALVLPKQIIPLTVALSEVGRGHVDDALMPPAGAGQGGPNATDKIYFMRVAVMAADEVRRAYGRGHTEQAGADIEDRGGLAPSTLRTWRRELRRATSELAPDFRMKLRIRRSPLAVIRWARWRARLIQGAVKKNKRQLSK